MSLVIVEGPDGSGKTTLIEYLRKSLHPYTWILKSNSKPQTVEDIIHVLTWITHAPPGLPLILDRHPLISETVYGPILRGASRMPLNPQDLSACFPPDTLVVYCRPSVNAIHEGAKTEEQMKGVITKLGKIITAYDTLMASLKDRGVKVHEYDYAASPSHQQEIRRLIENVRT